MIDVIPVYTGVHHDLYAYLAGCVDCDVCGKVNKLDI